MERRGGSAEKQEWEEGRRFGGRIVVERKEAALRTAKEWNRPDTVWTDGSRQEDGAVGAACVWRSPEGMWTGRRFQLGKNKEAFDAEVFAVWQALRALEQRNESDCEYTIFVDSTSAITRVRDDARGPGQRLGVAATGRAPRERLLEGYAEETSLAQMTRVAGARSRAVIDWITEHVRPG